MIQKIQSTIFFFYIGSWIYKTILHRNFFFFFLILILNICWQEPELPQPEGQTTVAYWERWTRPWLCVISCCFVFGHKLDSFILYRRCSAVNVFNITDTTATSQKAATFNNSQSLNLLSCTTDFEWAVTHFAVPLTRILTEYLSVSLRQYLFQPVVIFVLHFF